MKTKQGMSLIGWFFMNDSSLTKPSSSSKELSDHDDELDLQEVLIYSVFLK